MEISSEVVASVTTAVAGIFTAVLVPVARRFIRHAQERTQAEIAARAEEAKARERERALEREDRQRERDSCEARFVSLSSEISQVRSAYNDEVVRALRESSVALAGAAAAQHEGNLVMDRLCRRFEGLPCARDGEKDKTPLSQKHA